MPHEYLIRESVFSQPCFSDNWRNQVCYTQQLSHCNALDLFHVIVFDFTMVLMRPFFVISTYFLFSYFESNLKSEVDLKSDVCQSSPSSWSCHQCRYPSDFLWSVSKPRLSDLSPAWHCQASLQWFERLRADLQETSGAPFYKSSPSSSRNPPRTSRWTFSGPPRTVVLSPRWTGSTSRSCPQTEHPQIQQTPVAPGSNFICWRFLSNIKSSFLYFPAHLVLFFCWEVGNANHFLQCFGFLWCQRFLTWPGKLYIFRSCNVYSLTAECTVLARHTHGF